MDELQQAVAPFLPASGGGMEGFNPPPAPSDNSVFVCTDEPTYEVGEVSQRAPRKRVWQAAFDDSREMRLADKHSLACDERIQEIVDRAKALYANKDLDIQIKEEADIERGVQSFFADIYKFDDHRNQLFPAAPEIVKMLIKPELPTGKEYLRARKLTDEDHELVGELGTFTVEALLIHLEDLPLKINLLMVSQPLDWEPKNPKIKPKTLADLKGGYLTGRTANISDRYSLLSSKIVKNLRVLLNDEHEALCSIMNALQRQAFKINEEHLKYIKDNYQLLVNCNMLQPKFLCCINTKDIAEVLKKAFLNDPDIRKSVSFSFILTLLLNNIEQARYEKLILEMAEAFLGYDFYMPAFIDFRGRIYRSGILHFHERDLARSLIIFSDPKYKKGDEIDKILVTAAAFHFKSFSSTIEAQEWYPSQDKPGQLSYVDIAKNAKDPFQFLSSILLNLHTGDPSFRYNSPITKDASASAFQIISYFLLDETMARRTNLIPDEKGRFLDIYSCMREELLDFIKEHVSPVLYDTVLNQLTRKVVKSVYMPKIYGKTYKTTRDDLANKIGNDMEDKALSSGMHKPLFPAGIEVSRAGEGDAFQERANQKFHFEFRTSTSCCSWCFTISIGNERRSGGTCETTYWITPVRHEAADAESAPMPLAMPCLVPRHGGGYVARHEHRAKGRWTRYPHLRSDEWRTDNPGFSRALAGSGVPVKGASAYPRVIFTTCTSNLGTVERVTLLLFHSTTFVPVIHSLTERSSEGQPAHTASGEDGTTGKDRLAKTSQARSMEGAWLCYKKGRQRHRMAKRGGSAAGLDFQHLGKLVEINDSAFFPSSLPGGSTCVCDASERVRKSCRKVSSMFFRKPLRAIIIYTSVIQSNNSNFKSSLALTTHANGCWKASTLFLWASLRTEKVFGDSMLSVIGGARMAAQFQYRPDSAKDIAGSRERIGDMRQEQEIRSKIQASETEKAALLTLNEDKSIGETDAGYYDIPLYSRFKQVEYKGVPHPLSGDYTPRNTKSTQYSTVQSMTVMGELGTVSYHSVNADPIHDPYSIPSIEQITMPPKRLKPKVPKPTHTDILLKKTIFVCGSLSHLIKDCDYYEKKMAREAALKSKRVVHADVRQATPAWTNTNRVNKANQFTPRPVQLRTDNQEKDEKQSQNDKTGLGMEKTVKDKAKSKPESQSSQKVNRKVNWSRSKSTQVNPDKSKSHQIKKYKFKG
ncbi:DNA-dependent RNA polymerase [Tanacetum coccineum]